VSAEIIFLDAGRLRPLTEAADRYVGMAEKAIAVLTDAVDERERAAICGITEAWLSLAEAKLRPLSHHG
jgi:hypothetical protein